MSMRNDPYRFIKGVRQEKGFWRIDRIDLRSPPSSAPAREVARG